MAESTHLVGSSNYLYLSAVPSTPIVEPHVENTDHPLAPVIALCFGGLAASLTQTMVIPIQAELPRLLGSDAASTAWVVTITLLTAAVFMPISGRLADLYGKQRVLVATAGLLLIGSVVCALADTLLPMLIGRGLQGISMGFIPVGISMIREVTPPAKANSAIAAMSATMGVGGAVGLPLSAWIADAGDWHLMFWLSAVVAAIVLALTWFAVPHVRDEHPGGLDIVGGLGMAVGLGSFLVGVSKGTTWGWDDGRTLGAIAFGVVVLVAWGFFELRVADPLVDLRASASRPVLLANLAGMAIGFGMMAQMVAIPQLLEMPEATGYGLGQSVLHAGLWMAPGGLVMMAFAPVSSMLITRLGARLTLMIGGTVLGVGYLVALGLTGAAWQLMLASCISSAGVGIGYAALPTLILDAVPTHEAAAAVGLNSLMRSVGTTLAAAAMGTVLTSITMDLGGVAIPRDDAFSMCFVIGALAAFVGVAIAALIPRRVVALTT